VQPGEFYGTTVLGGYPGLGVIYKITSAGNFTLVHSFSRIDGADPHSPLFIGSGGTLYGTTFGGGQFDYGTVYTLAAAGEVVVLHSFNEPDDGFGPQGLTLGRDGNIYGLPWEQSKLFRIVIPPQITSVRRTGSQTTIGWNSFNDGRYRIDTSASTPGNRWAPLSTTVVATGSVASVEDTTSAAARFYRVVLLP
jgi:uncharacterized repeat protein (TIGR03803 family)